ncbi:MAG: hypothetical protein V1843_00520 [bacterium]
MRIFTILLIVIATTTLAYALTVRPNDTAQFLGPYRTKTIIELRDIQGLFGGRNIIVNGSGIATVEAVYVDPKTKKLAHKTYTAQICKCDVENFLYMAIAKDFVNIKIKERLGVPDEARPTITITNFEGKKHSISKWANDSNERFDVLYSELLKIEDKVKKLKQL